MFKPNPILAIDSYKLGHMSMYPDGTTKVYCNFTPRSSSKLKDVMPEEFYDGKIVVYGVSSAFQEIVESFDTNFFNRPRQEVLDEFIAEVKYFIGESGGSSRLVSNVENLHKLGYLPLRVKSLPEGIRINAGIPMLTITNTHPDFAWLPNYLETFISSQIWKLSTAATIADVYKRIFVHFAEKTGADKSFTLFQGHDFSCRGMSGFVDAARTGSAHLTSFMGTDSVSSVQYARKYYNAWQDFIAGSVPATEHSIMQMSGKDDEIGTFKRIFDKYDRGVVSIVSDTYDYWNTITNIASELKDDIMAREKDSMGLCKTVFRPDSGDPVDVIVGLDHVAYNTAIKYGDILTPEHKGSVQCLWEIFGGTETHKGYKVLDEHVGLIYGDSITPKRAVSILHGLERRGFASSNIVLGIGSFTYQYVTRDSLGFAMKATYAEINGVGHQIFKEPKTDSGKKSAKGMLRVDFIGGEYVLKDGLDDDTGGELTTIFVDGAFGTLPTLDEVRVRLSNQ